jgi:hypothetical protein
MMVPPVAIKEMHQSGRLERDQDKYMGISRSQMHIDKKYEVVDIINLSQQLCASKSRRWMAVRFSKKDSSACLSVPNLPPEIIHFSSSSRLRFGILLHHRLGMVDTCRMECAGLSQLIQCNRAVSSFAIPHTTPQPPAIVESLPQLLEIRFCINQ